MKEFLETELAKLFPKVVEGSGSSHELEGAQCNSFGSSILCETIKAFKAHNAEVVSISSNSLGLYFSVLRGASEVANSQISTPFPDGSFCYLTKFLSSIDLRQLSVCLIPVCPGMALLVADTFMQRLQHSMNEYPTDGLGTVSSGVIHCTSLDGKLSAIQSVVICRELACGSVYDVARVASGWALMSGGDQWGFHDTLDEVGDAVLALGAKCVRLFGYSDREVLEAALKLARSGLYVVSSAASQSTIRVYSDLVRSSTLIDASSVLLAITSIRHVPIYDNKLAMSVAFKDTYSGPTLKHIDASPMEKQLVYFAEKGGVRVGDELITDILLPPADPLPFSEASQNLNDVYRLLKKEGFVCVQEKVMKDLVAGRVGIDTVESYVGRL